MGVAFEDPALRAALAAIELTDDDSGTSSDDAVRVGREGFQLLLHLVARNVAAPNFDPEATRQLVDDALLTLVDDADARAAVRRLLDVVFLPTEPGSPVFSDLQELMRCVEAEDQDRAMAGMFYDWLTIEELSPVAFLADAASQAESDAAIVLRPVVVRLFASLAARPSLATDSARVVAGFLGPEHSAATVRMLLDLKGKGVMFEWLNFVDELEGCR
jgi:hypothetical protein